VVIQVQDDAGNWTIADALLLPRGSAVLPASGSIPPDLLANPDRWKNARDEPLVSTALQAVDGSGVVSAYPGDRWCGITFGPDGMVVAGGGVMVLAAATTAPTDAACPARCRDAREVRGVLVSRYGVPVALNGWGEL
jgi:hypothetical protein